MTNSTTLEVNETYDSLIGLKGYADQLLAEVVLPLRYHRFGNDMKCPPSLEPGEAAPVPPKFILLTGPVGVGKSALTSVIANELRRGPYQKSGRCQKFVDSRIKYILWEKSYLRPNRAESLRAVMDEAREDNDRDLTVFHFNFIEFTFTPAMNNVSPTFQLEPPDPFVDVVREELASWAAGKILIVGTSCFPKILNNDVLALVDRRYDISLPDHETKKEMLLSLLEKEGAVMSDEDLEWTVTTRIDERIYIDFKLLSRNLIQRAKARLGDQNAPLQVQREDLEIEEAVEAHVVGNIEDLVGPREIWRQQEEDDGPPPAQRMRFEEEAEDEGESDSDSDEDSDEEDEEGA